jgi:hypothetical protein
MRHHQSFYGNLAVVVETIVMMATVIVTAMMAVTYIEVGVVKAA